MSRRSRWAMGWNAIQSISAVVAAIVSVAAAWSAASCVDVRRTDRLEQQAASNLQEIHRLESLIYQRTLGKPYWNGRG
ncbi:MAG: hypothetical protein AAF958_00830 [Planctomycetota bacterium]